MDKCNCYHPAFLSHTASYEQNTLCQLEVMDRKEDQARYECVMDIMDEFDNGDIECISCKPACQ